MAARQRTDAGAEAFVRFYFAQFNVAWTEPRPGLIESLSDPSCQFCVKTEATAKYLLDHEQNYASPPIRLLSAELFGGAPQAQQFVEVRLQQNEADILDAHGDVIHTDPKKIESFYVTLRWTPRGWRTLELERTQ